VSDDAVTPLPTDPPGPRQPPPAFQIYARDFLERTAHLSLAEQGAVIRLLCHQWIRGPLEDRHVGRLLGCAPEEPLPEAVIEEFFPYNGDGLRADPGLEAYRADLAAYHRKQAESGRRGAEKLWRTRKRR